MTLHEALERDLVPEWIDAVVKEITVEEVLQRRAEMRRLGEQRQIKSIQINRGNDDEKMF